MFVVVYRTASEIRLVRVVFESRGSVDYRCGDHVFRSGGEHHRFIGFPAVVLDVGDEEEVVAHASHHSAFVAGVDLSVVVVGDLSYDRSTRGSGIHEVGIFPVVEFFQEYGRVGFAKLDALLVEFDDVIENFLVGLYERLGSVSELGERNRSKSVRIEGPPKDFFHSEIDVGIDAILPAFEGFFRHRHHRAHASSHYFTASEVVL